MFEQFGRFIRGVVVTTGARELARVVVRGVVVLAGARELVDVAVRPVGAAAAVGA